MIIFFDLLISVLQFEKKALADALSLYMRAIMSLNDQSRSKIVDPESIDDNFDHLKISCRAKGNQPQHYPFGEELFQKMKSVGFNFKRYPSTYLSFRLHLMAILVI